MKTAPKSTTREALGRDGSTAPRACTLTNGSLATLLTDAGAGGTTCGRFALTRWTPDAVRDADGTFLYLRDLDDGAVWSAGHQPVRRAPDEYAVRLDDACAAIERRDGTLRSRLDVCVTAGYDAELRRLTLTNLGTQRRRIEVTTYAEVALDTPAAVAAHPAFSKLFVQTDWWRGGEALLAWRRPRTPDDESLWLGQRLVGGAGGTEYETDRARFIGRGRTPAMPRALVDTAPLGGTVGGVLDPVFAQRRVLVVEPGASAALGLVLVAAATRADAESLLEEWDLAAIVAALEEAERRVTTDDWSTPALGVATVRPVADPSAVYAPDGLLHFNGHGGFAADGREYVIHVGGAAGDDALPPLPWANVIANERAGCIVSERGAVHSWAGNSREHRLTPWLNDPVSDPTGEALWVRDERTGDLWSPTPGPSPSGAPYRVRHGLGYTTFEHEARGLSHRCTVFVPRDEPLRVVRLVLRNEGAVPRELTVWSFAQLVLGDLAHRTAPTVEARVEPPGDVVLARNPAAGEFADRVALASAWCSARDARVSATCDRAAFLGRHGDVAAPIAVVRGEPLDGRDAVGADPCAAFRVALVLAPGAEAELVFTLGEGDDEVEARALASRWRASGVSAPALREARRFWEELVATIQVETPSSAIDLMVDGWLVYQNLSCRIWGRSAYYQSGGAYGFRDQLQDASALVHLWPQLTRRQIVLHASHQFVEGDVLHWWHPPASRGIRTRFADDLLWLPLLTAHYVATTGDESVLDESARFVTARPLAADEDEALLVPDDSGTAASVYEHCCRAIDRSLTAGARGLPLMGVGDWNDGMNRVGREGRGESVWLGFFLHEILDEWVPLCAARGDEERAARYRAFQRALLAALDEAGWDGAWYRRAYYDDGTPLGSHESDECRIDAIAQAWSVLSGAATEERAGQALDAMERWLVSEDEGIIRLLTPAFDRTPHDPGYIKGYLPGVRENGGQYTHGALWAVRALAELGRAERAAPLLEMLSPVTRGGSAEAARIYKVEPYVVAADVYGVAPHVGRGGWTWYTGSAGWMYRVALESILGLRVERGRELVIRPCIPASWPGFRATWRVGPERTTLAIEVTRDAGATRATLDDVDVPIVDGAVRVPLPRDGTTHRVLVQLGDDVGPRYRPSRSGA
ncbi:MAG TPA: hypothetical protein VEA99_05475 [Gemmatimonadaceae bacterium]|nr:hypothetical protein [Gemmatimonadaceae bacterium]